MKATRHNGRAGKHGIYNPKHNDRRFNLENSEHIDPERSKFNVYWDCYQGYDLPNNEKKAEMSFEDIEKAYYINNYSDFVDAQNERNIQYRHPERNRTVQSLRDDKRTCPEETVLQLGNIDGSVSPSLLAKISTEYFEEFEKRYGSNVHMLDWALHLDESTPHIHERHVFDALNKYGELAPQQEKALEELGFELPNPNKKKSKFNNRKIVFDAECRKLFIDIAERNGVSLDLEVVSGGKSYLEKQDFIIENQKKRIAEKQEQLDNLMMKVSDVNAVIDEAVDLAYDKACEVVTEQVKEETVKHDIDVVKDYGKWLTDDKNDKVTPKTKSVGAKIVDAIVTKLEKASQKLLSNVINRLNEPVIKKKAKEEVKEKARISIQDKLNKYKEEIKAEDKLKPSQNKKIDMER